jgi:hypothetical protein
VQQERMEEGSHRYWQVRLLVVLLVGVAAVAAGAVALMRAPSPTASAQEVPINDDPSFGVRCDFSHRNNDDPIVHPNNPGAAHRHDFFGNTSTDAFSTLESLRAAGTTCARAADKSAYWIPTVKWGGKKLKASSGVFYYRANQKDPTQVQSFPAGLKMVPNSHVEWRCVGGTPETPYAKKPPTRCSNGKLGVRIVFPDCSNGKLDSARHRSHMAYAEEQGDGTKQCPSTHPISLPSLRATIEFPLPTNRGQVTLSSGDASTMHADFFNAWEQKALDALLAACISGFDPSLPRPEMCKAQGA